jgi:Protein of unknown function (DUF3489)
MLRVPGGVTIEAMARAANWQPHSVRGFLAGVVRNRLFDLNGAAKTAITKHSTAIIVR